MSCRLALVILGLLACPLGLVTAQDIDANLSPQKRTPSTIADQITDSAEHDAFLSLFKPSAGLSHAAELGGTETKTGGLRQLRAGTRFTVESSFTAIGHGTDRAHCGLRGLVVQSGRSQSD